MGRTPKPTALLQLEKGKLYSDQRDRALLEPKAKRELQPRCPPELTEDERKVWNDFAAVLKNYGLFVAANASNLKRLARAYVLLERCEKAISKITPGRLRRNPSFRAMVTIAPLVDRYCERLGLSSTALAKLGSLRLKANKERDEFF